jgi:hypothetical protein
MKSWFNENSQLLVAVLAARAPPNSSICLPVFQTDGENNVVCSWLAYKQ